MKVLKGYTEPKEWYAGFPDELPDSLFNEEWAQRIHSQTLARLNERGGLHVKEMICNIQKKNWKEIDHLYTTQQAIEYLKTLIPCN